MRRFGATGAIVATFMLASPLPTAGAKDLSEIDFSLRLPAALSRFSPYSDVAGVGGASAASKYASSANPAATAWEFTHDWTVSISPQYAAIPFRDGPRLNVFAEAVTIRLGEFGAIQPAAAQVRSSGDTSGDYLRFRADYGQIQWGMRVRDWLGVGLNVNYTSSDVRAGLGGFPVVESHSDNFVFRGGLLARLSSSLMAGLVAEWGTGPVKTQTFSPLCGCYVESGDHADQILLRPGIAWEYAEKSTVYFDVHHGRFWNSFGHFNTTRINSGVEHRVFDWLYPRAGFAVNDRGHFTPTAGVGLYPTPMISIDLAFQLNPFSDVRPEFGSSKLFGISAAVTF
jgi:hypothetical protein